MFKLSNQVIDAYDDVTRDYLVKVAHLYPTTHYMSPEELSTLKDKDFAVSIITKKASKLNKFPINTRDNTLLANEYFDCNWHKLPKLAAEVAAFNIKTACKKFSITPKESVTMMAKTASSNVYIEEESAHASPRTEVLSMSKYANAQEIGDNYTTAQYAFTNPTEIKIACKYFEDNAAKMPIEVRHKYAAAIQRRAAEFGMPSQKGLVEKYASDSYSGALEAHLRSRMSLLETQPEHKANLEKLASMRKDLTPTQFARMLHGFDKTAKLERYYGAHLTNPYEATFTQMPDPYEGYRIKLGNQDLTHDDLQKLITSKYGKIKSYFGEHVAREMRQDPIAVFESFPMDAKEVMAGIANGTL
jgi:hypothetical protein